MRAIMGRSFNGVCAVRRGVAILARKLAGPLPSCAQFLSLVAGLVVLHGVSNSCAGADEANVFWGEPDGALTMGLCFPRLEYSIAEPITVIVIVKNSSDRAANMPTCADDPLNRIQFAASGSDRRALLPKEEFFCLEKMNLVMAGIPPGRAWAFELDLRDGVEISKPDDLVVTARRVLSRRYVRHVREIISGNAWVRIHAATTGQNTNWLRLPEEVQQALEAGRDRVRPKSEVRSFRPVTDFTRQVDSAYAAALARSQPPRRPPPTKALQAAATERQTTPNERPAATSAEALAVATPVAAPARVRTTGLLLARVLLLLLVAMLWRAARRNSP